MTSLSERLVSRSTSPVDCSVGRLGEAFQPLGVLGYVLNFFMMWHLVDCSPMVGVIKAKGWRRKELET